MAQARKYVDEKAIPQCCELIQIITRRFCGSTRRASCRPPKICRIMKAVREASPRVVISGRLVHGWGDYD